MRMLLLVALIPCACGGASGGAIDAGPCDPRIMAHTIEPSPHVEVGTPISYGSNPPASGAHYPFWARWAHVYDQPVERPVYVHNAEHGGVALLYRCADGCAADLQRLTRLAQDIPQDPRCSPPINARWLITPDPLLPPGIQFAAVTWGWTYTSTCYDEATLYPFVDEHYAQGSEDTCADGIETTQGGDAGPGPDAP